MEKDKWKGLFRPENKKMRSNILLALLAGVLLLTLGRSFSGGEKEEQVQESRQQTVQADREIEERMAAILSEIAGAGEVDVMLTFRQTEEKMLAQNKTTEESGETLRLEETAILLEDGKGNTSPVILTENSPIPEGVVIVAQGGDDPVVSAALHQAAQALLDIPAHKVAVLKKK